MIQNKKVFMRNFLIIFILFMAMFSCKPEFPSWENDTVFPLADVQLFLKDITGDTILTEGNDSLLYLYYDYSLADFGLDSVINNLDTISSLQYISPVTFTVPPGTMILNKSEVKKLQLNDILLKILKISHGTIRVSVQNKYTQPIHIEFSLPEASVNGVPFVISREIPPASSSSQPLTYTEDIELSNIIWTFFTNGSSNYNCYNSLFKVWVSSEATEDVQVSFNDPFNFYLGFKELNISYARGFFGQQQYNLSHETTFDFFRNITADQFNIEDVQLFFEITNTMGMDLQLILSELTGINIHTGQSIQYDGPLLHSVIQIPRAQETSPGQGLAQPQTYIFDLAQNSNLKQFIELMPGKLSSQLKFEINPLGNISSGNDFYYGIPARANLSFRLPLDFSVQNLTLSDTLPFSGEFLKKQVQSMSIRAVMMNCFPLEFTMNMAFLDCTQTELCNVPFDVPVRAAPLTSNGRTAGPEKTSIQLHIPNTTVDEIRNAAYIVISASVTTLPHGSNVKIFSDYSLDIKTFAMLNLLIQND